MLAPTSARKDITDFMAVKKVRGDSLHTAGADPAELPANPACDLLRKYFRLHLDRETGRM